MSGIPELVAAIDRRLVDIAGEISALDAAKAELAAARTGGQAPPITTDATATRRRRRTAGRRLTPSPTSPELARDRGEGAQRSTKGRADPDGAARRWGRG